MTVTRPSTPCVPHDGYINPRGYGMVGGKLAHRSAWEAEHGPIEPGGTLDHLCHDPEVCKLGDACPHRRCKALDHLEVVSYAVNAERAGKWNRDKDACPDGHPYAGDNLLISGGKRYCRICRRRNQQAIRYAAYVAGCVAAGHEREEAVDSAGRTYCVVCRAAAAAVGGATRSAGAKTKAERKTAKYATHQEWRRRKAADVCRADGHEPDLVESRITYCRICRSKPKKRGAP